MACAATIIIGAGPASAHDDSGNSIALVSNDQRLLVTAPVLFSELGYKDTTGDGLLAESELRTQETTVSAGLVDAVRDHVAIQIDGQDVEIIGAGHPAQSVLTAPSEYVQVLFATGPHDGDVSNVGMDWSFTSPSTQVLLAGPDGSVAGQLSEDGTVSITVGAGATIRSFLVTGMDHVFSGLDHLLFLVVLTFAVVGSAVTRATTLRVVALVTAFTIGHATSLTLAYFDLVSIPAHWVEPAISLSIVAAAVLAIRGKGDTIRPWLAALIGLVHGLGFASSLSTLGLVTAHHVSALAAFNIGIDLAQTFVVLVVTAAIWVVGKIFAERRSWFRVAICSGAGLLGLAWTASRVLT